MARRTTPPRTIINSCTAVCSLHISDVLYFITVRSITRCSTLLGSRRFQDLGECKTMGTPPKGVDDVFAATMVLLAGTSPSVITTKAGKVKDRSWDAAKKQLLGEVWPSTAHQLFLLSPLNASLDHLGKSFFRSDDKHNPSLWVFSMAANFRRRHRRIHRTAEGSEGGG